MENITATLSIEDIKLLLNPPQEKTLKDFSLKEIVTEVIRRSGVKPTFKESYAPIAQAFDDYCMASGELREGGTVLKFTIIDANQK